VPTIAYFLGIAVRMFFNDHEPPHFHVRYQGFRARVLIATGDVIDGHLPSRVVRLVKEWTDLRRVELLRNWRAAQLRDRLEHIAGLEDDD
jgi:hypothetical protein